MFHGWHCKAVRVYSAIQRLKLGLCHYQAAPHFMRSCLSPEILTLKEVFQISTHGKLSTASPTSLLCISLICTTFTHPATHSGPLPPSNSTVLQGVKSLQPGLAPLKNSPTKQTTLIPSPLLSQNSYAPFLFVFIALCRWPWGSWKVLLNRNVLLLL